MLAAAKSPTALPTLVVADAPRFRHRGILVDSGRHFEPVRQLKHTIRALRMHKMNTLHWHLPEDQSFPMLLTDPSFFHPELAQQAAWTFPGRGAPLPAAAADVPGEVYTNDDLREVVAYANKHGVRVVPEFDMPGHETAWSVSHPEAVVGGY